LLRILFAQLQNLSREVLQGRDSAQARVLQIQGGRGVFEKSTSHVDEVEYDTAEEEEESFFILQLLQHLQQKEQIPPSQVLDLFSVRSSILLDHWIHPRATRQTHFSVCSL